jgi:hypothetical protein
MVDLPTNGISMPDITKLSMSIPSNLFGMSWVMIGDILGGLIVIGFLLYFFTKRGKVKWNVAIYERDSSGIPIPIDEDVLDEKSLNKGKNTMYILRKYKSLAHPPVSKFIYRRKKGMFGTELWCDYLREGQDFIPVQRLAQLGLNTKEDVGIYTKRLQEIYESKPEEVKQKYIYSPLIPQAIPRLKYEPMEYNMTEMLQVRLAQREMLYADKQGWMQQYGPMVGIGLAAVAIIVVAYLGFQFASAQIGSTTAAANTVAEKLSVVADRL